MGDSDFECCYSWDSDHNTNIICLEDATHHLFQNIDNEDPATDMFHLTFCDEHWGMVVGISLLEEYLFTNLDPSKDYRIKPGLDP